MASAASPSLDDESSYDVFISYAGDDSGWVEGYLLPRLTGAGVKCLTTAGFVPGSPTIREYERAVRSSRKVLLIISPFFLADGTAELVTILGQSYGLETRTWPVIPLYLRPVLPDRVPVFLRAIEGLDAKDPADWHEVTNRLGQAFERPIVAAETIPNCPYPGMERFDEAQSQYFFGRAKEITEAIGMLRQEDGFLAVIGASGSGKSSLVLAGLVPKLRDARNLSLFGGGEWLIKTIRPGRDPQLALQEIFGEFRDDPAVAVKSLIRQHAGASRLLLIVDQFEEVFSATGDAKVFFEAMRKLAEAEDCYIVLTVRADFFDKLMTCPLWPFIKDCRYELLPLDKDGLREAIFKPAEMVGVAIERALVECLVTEAADQPGSLPFLQETLVLLWPALQEKYLPLYAYETLGTDQTSGIEVAMQRRADAALAKLSRELGPDGETTARRIFLRLIQFGEGRNDTRRQQTVAELRAGALDPALFQATLDYLSGEKSRLITVTGADLSERKADLAHEALINGWPTLRRWINEWRHSEQTRRRLEEKAEEWVVRGQGRGGLLDEVELPEAERWLAGRDAADLGFDAIVPALVNASADFLARQRRATRRRARFLIAGLSIGFAVVAVLALWGARSTNEARAEAESAHIEESRAKSANQLAVLRTVELAMQRGAWRPALRSIDQALRDGCEDRVGLKLDRVEALCGIHDISGAIAEIQSIVASDKLGKHQARALLLQGELEWFSSLSLERPMDLVRQALEKGLPEPADQAYAKGLVAQTVPDAVRQLQLALEAKPAHHRANSMLTTLFLLEGRIKEARNRVAAAQALFPDDQTFTILDAWTAAADGDLSATNASLDHLRSKLSDQQMKCARGMVDLLNRVRNIELTNSKELVEFVLFALRQLATNQGLFQPQGSGPTTLFFPNPPVLSKLAEHVVAFGQAKARSMVLGDLLGDRRKVDDALSRMVAIDREGVFLFLQAFSAFENDRFQQAEKLALDALEAPSLFHVSNPAKTIAMFSEWILSNRKPGDRGLEQKAIEKMREIVDSEGKVDVPLLPSFLLIAIKAKDWDRARRITAHWERGAPNDLNATKARASVELQSGEYARSIEAAMTILRRIPHDAEALRIRSSAASKIQEYARSLTFNEAK